MRSRDCIVAVIVVSQISRSTAANFTISYEESGRSLHLSSQYTLISQWYKHQAELQVVTHTTFLTLCHSLVSFPVNGLSCVSNLKEEQQISYRNYKCTPLDQALVRRIAAVSKSWSGTPINGAAHT